MLKIVKAENSFFTSAKKMQKKTQNLGKVGIFVSKCKKIICCDAPNKSNLFSGVHKVVGDSSCTLHRLIAHRCRFEQFEGAKMQLPNKKPFEIYKSKKYKMHKKMLKSLNPQKNGKKLQKMQIMQKSGKSKNA